MNMTLAGIYSIKNGLGGTERNVLRENTGLNASTNTGTGTFSCSDGAGAYTVWCTVRRTDGNYCTDDPNWSPQPPNCAGTSTRQISCVTGPTNTQPPTNCSDSSISSLTKTCNSTTKDVAINYSTVSSCSQYEIQKATNSSFTNDLVTVTDTASPYTFTALTKNISHFFRVRCRYANSCNPDLSWSGYFESTTCPAATSTPTPGQCTGTFTNSTMWDAEESTGLSANLGKTHSATDTGTKCQFYCNSGFTWNGSSCAAAPPANCASPSGLTQSTDCSVATNKLISLNWNDNVTGCTQYEIDKNTVNTFPNNANANDFTGVSNFLYGTGWPKNSDHYFRVRCSLSTSCTVGNFWSSSVLSLTCPVTQYNCTGTTPTNAALWDAEESTGLTANLGKTYSATDTGTK